MARHRTRFKPRRAISSAAAKLRSRLRRSPLLRPLTAPLYRIRHRAGLTPLEVWRSAAGSELDYWRGFLAEHADVEWRIANQDPSDTAVWEVVDGLEAEEVSMLDVGAGPISTLTAGHPKKRVVVTAVDPLAEGYDRLLAEIGLDPPVRTVGCEGERLLERFEPESFDVAYARNALDHAYDPIRVIESMIAVTRWGGAVVLNHLVNEGATGLYRGFHQWNFEPRKGRLFVWNHESEHDVSTLFADRATARCWSEDERVVAVLALPPSD